MARLFLIRHAESEGNRDGVFTATDEVPLTERGRAQARAAARWLRHHGSPQHVVSSPFTRARETAAIIAEMIGVPTSIEHDLRERCYGRLAGMPYATPRPDYDATAYWLWRPEQGETLVEVACRVGPVLDRLAQESGGDVVIVSHGAAMMAAQWHVTSRWPPAGRVVPNAGIVLVEHGEAGFRTAEVVCAAEDGPVG